MTTLTRYEPLVGPLDNLFNEFFRPVFVWDNRAPADVARIRVDVKETGEAYTVDAEIPGVKKDDIQVSIDGNEVAISAQLKSEIEEKDGEKWLRAERLHGRFERRFALPQEIDDGKASARFTDGVLSLTLPKKQAAAARKVEIS
jgi:HSP20 family protein